MENKFYTTPIYYVNDKPHIGHAYTSISVDVLKRFHKLKGIDTYFLTGTDEHGQKVEKAAQDKNIDPKKFTDQVSENFRALSDVLNLDNDDFIRTTEERHKTSVQNLWQKLIDNDEIYLSKYAGWYSVRDEAFVAENEITEVNGIKFNSFGSELSWVEEESYFFRLSKWQNRLLELYDEVPDFVHPKSRLNEVKSFVSGGLRDLSVSRTTFNWGIDVPNDDKHIMYVWLDALANYISALGFPDQENDKYKSFWPGIHVVGKDILRFHAVYWPAFLMAAGLLPPKQIVAHGWWTNEGEKISKSLGNVIDPIELIDSYGLDQLRYFLMREVPFGNDGDFSHQAMVNRMNGELANDLGNLAQRVLSMVAKNCGGVVPQHGDFTNDDLALLEEAGEIIEKLRYAFDSQLFHEALEIVWVVIRAANVYVDSQAPWKLRKDDPSRMATVLYVLSETIRRIALILQPFMPDTMSCMLEQLAVSAHHRTFAHLNKDHYLKPGTTLPEPKGLFPRFMTD